MEDERLSVLVFILLYLKSGIIDHELKRLNCFKRQSTYDLSSLFVCLFMLLEHQV